MSANILLNPEDILNVEELEQILDAFTKATGMVSLITDYRGNPITTITRFCPICQAVRKDPEKAKRCVKCDALSGLEASINGQPCIYRCHAGLVEVTYAITVDGRTVANLMTGQIVPDDADLDQLPYLCEERTDLRKEPELAPIYEAYLKEASPMSYEKIKSYANFLIQIANYIAKMGYEKILQRRLLEQDKKLLENKNIKLRSKLTVDQYSSSFLNEAFNTVYNVALLENAEKTSNLLFSLSSLFKRNIATDTHYISLDKEIEDIHNVIDLFNISFNREIELVVERAESVSHDMMPLIGLHSIIANVFLSMIPNNNKKGQIHLSVVREGGALKCRISCDAVPFPDINFKTIDQNDDLSAFFPDESTMTLRLVAGHLSDFYSDEFEMFTKDNVFTLQVPSVLK